jgi:hypothetical protein
MTGQLLDRVFGGGVIMRNCIDICNVCFFWAKDYLSPYF